MVVEQCVHSGTDVIHRSGGRVIATVYSGTVSVYTVVLTSYTGVVAEL